ncbi:MAG: universal stress protein [Gammaproteobacteria bacterium]|nr:universal stress protein [Gammaproteobacteria bacterium]
MNSLNHVLLASHGTTGAQAAEQMAIRMCTSGAKLHHLIVVPNLWKGMTGDDWLNNGSTRNTYRRYLESELGREVDEHCERISKNAEEKNLQYSSEIVLGEPEKCLINSSKKATFDLVIMGSPRPKGIKGLRSRMKTESLTHALEIPLLIVPYPPS